MFLRRLTLENIRSIKALEIDFTAPGSSDKVRQWTCLLGENGTGKSTILRSLGLLMAGSDTLPKLLDDPTRWVRLGAKSGQISAQIITQDGDARDISLAFKAGQGLSAMLKSNEAHLKPLDAALKHTARNYFTVGYGVSRRFPSPESERFQTSSSMPPRAQSVATLFRADASLRSIESWAMDLHYRKGSSGLRVIREALNAVLPEVKFHSIDKKKRQLIFETADGRVPLAQLSDGYQSVISWYGDLLYRITEVFQDYKKPQHAHGLLMLDEVDLHLHPKWQRHVIEFLRQTLPNFQFLATTHSPLTAQQCGEGELYVLKREKTDSVRLHHYDAAPNLLRIDQLLVSPLFGIETGMSVAVQEVRSKKLRTKKDTELLRSVPRRRPDAETEEEKIALLRDVRAALGSRSHAAKKPKMLGVPITSASSTRRRNGRNPRTGDAIRIRARAAAPAPYIRPTAGSMVSAALKAK